MFSSCIGFHVQVGGCPHWVYHSAKLLRSVSIRSLHSLVDLIRSSLFSPQFLSGGNMELQIITHTKKGQKGIVL